MALSMSMEMSSFLKGMKTNFCKLSFAERGIVTAILFYGGFKVSLDVFKLMYEVIPRSKNKPEPTDAKYDQDKLYLHMFPRSITKQVPNLSPFSIKVETWLRLKDIKYEAVGASGVGSSRTGQIPYLYHKGQEICDSNFIVEYLENFYGLDNTEGLSSEEVATSRAIGVMVEESTSYTGFIHRYCFKYKEFYKIFSVPFPKVLMYFLADRFAKEMLDKFKKRGIGRKTPEEIYHIAEMDLNAISKYLGDKQFLMGENMTKVDCAVFGQLSQIVFVDFHYPQMDVIKRECQNILPYMERIKKKCWPDWDQIVPQGHFS